MTNDPTISCSVGRLFKDFIKLLEYIGDNLKIGVHTSYANSL